MANAVQKITLSASRDIPFNKLVLSQSNVRRIKAGVSIEELAEDIARRTLLQSLNVRPVLDAEGAGDRHVRDSGRRPPLPGAGTAGQAEAPGQDRAHTLRGARGRHRRGRLPRRERPARRRFIRSTSSARSRPCARKGQSEEEIAAAFFVAVNVVKQRLRLAAVSEKLLDVYAEDGMSLDQLMAFTVTIDHARQEQVWEAIQQSYSKEPYQIRRMLTERTVRASDKRARIRRPRRL